MRKLRGGRLAVSWHSVVPACQPIADQMFSDQLPTKANQLVSVRNAVAWIMLFSYSVLVRSDLFLFEVLCSCSKCSILVCSLLFNIYSVCSHV